MPKKPKIEHPLRKLREITGKSQVAFARVLGCSTSTIKKIEGGDNSKFNASLLISLASVFGVAPNSLLPPSTQPTEIDGKPYTKEFFEGWWKKAPEVVKPWTLLLKELMVRDLEMVLAAAMRAPGMGFGGVYTSFYVWLMGMMDDCQFWPHYEAELNERVKKGKNKPNKVQADWELVQSFIENKSKFLQEAFESDLRVTTLVQNLEERKKGNLKKRFPTNLEELPKLEKLKAQMNIVAKLCEKMAQAGTVANSTPKRTR